MYKNSVRLSQINRARFVRMSCVSDIPMNSDVAGWVTNIIPIIIRIDRLTMQCAVICRKQNPVPENKRSSRRMIL